MGVLVHEMERTDGGKQMRPRICPVTQRSQQVVLRPGMQALLAGPDHKPS